KVSQEVVVTRLRLRRDEPIACLGKSLLHLQARERPDDAFDIAWRNCIDAEAAVVEPDAQRAYRNLWLLVKRQRWCRVQGNQVPNQLGTPIREVLASDKRKRGIGAVYLETIRACHAVREPDIVKQRADCDDLMVVVDALYAADRFCEQPRT